MKENEEKFLLSEYGNSRIQPYSYSFGQYDIIVPKEYASPFETFDSLEKALFDKYLGENRLKEEKKYAKIGMKAPRLRTGDLFLIKPFRMRNLSDEEALKKVTAEVFRRYRKAISLAIKLHNAEPDRKHPVKVGTADVKKMNAAYNKILLEKFGNDTCVAAAKISNAAQKQGRFLRGTLARLSASLLKVMAKKYNRQLSQLQKFYRDHRMAVKTTGGIALGALLAAGTAHKNNSEKDAFTPNYEQLSRMQEPADEQLESQVKQYTLSKYVVQHLNSIGLGPDKLNTVQKHNLELYLATREERDVMIAFTEDFLPVGIDDRKGYGTNGYGSTFKIDEKTGNITRRIRIGEKTTKEKALKAVDANSDFHFLPHLLTDVTVDLSETPHGDRIMVVLNDFAHLTGPNIGATSFCKALNQKRPLKELCQHLARWNIDPGVIKKVAAHAYFLYRGVNIADILEMRPAGCYNNEVYDVIACNKNADGSVKMEKKRITRTLLLEGREVKKTKIEYRPSFKMKNGLPYFNINENAIAQFIENAKPKGNEKTVADILPQELLTNIRQKLMSSQYVAIAKNDAKTSYAFYEAAQSKNSGRN